MSLSAGDGWTHESDWWIGALGWLLSRHGRDHQIPLAMPRPGGLEVQLVRVTAEGAERVSEFVALGKAAEREVVSAETWATLRADTTPGTWPFTLGVGVPLERVPPGGRLAVSISAHAISVAWDEAWIGEETARRVVRQLGALAELWAADPESLIEPGRLLDAEDRSLLRSVATPGPWDDTAPSIVEALRRSAGRLPHRPAVESEEGSLSYGDLLARAGEIAAGLRALGVEPGDPVGVHVDRSLDQVVTTVAVLLAGGCYVPLDPFQPDARLQVMARAAGVKRVVTADDPGAEGARGWAGEAPVNAVAELRGHGAEGDAPALGLDDPAYVMFTSGSTGEPKGVVVPHRGVLRLCRGSGFARLDETTRFLGFAPHGFDAATLEIWGPLLNGGTLVLAPAGLPSLERLGDVLRERRVTTAWFTAAIFRDMVEYQLESLGGLRELLAGGDVLSTEHVGRLRDRFPGVQLVNGYGPTENTTFTTCHRLGSSERLWPSVPIGRPIAGTGIHVLDPRGRAVAPGMVGELYATGAGLALGYLGEGSAGDGFVTLDGGEAAYRTGDAVRLLDGGVLEFLGRVDRQEKIRGFRVELEEVEAAMAGYPGIRAAAVAAWGPPGRRSLVAGVVPVGEALDEGGLRDFLRSRLPEYMVPERILPLARLPINRNGKVDRGALAGMAQGRPSDDDPVDASDAHGLEGWEATLQQLWTELLPTSFGLDDAFFDVGGTSLMVLRLVQHVKSRTGRDLSPVRVFEFPTIRGLAAHLAGSGQEGSPTATAPAPRVRTGDSDDGDDRNGIAVIGMAGRFPGASNVEALWRLLDEGREGTRRFSPEELDPRVPREELGDPGYVPVRGVLRAEEVEGFDAELFGIHPRVAEIMDPQHRLLMETAWEAFEDAGRRPGGRVTGVFVGMSHNTWLEQVVAQARDVREAVGALQFLLGNDKDFAANRIAHALDLTGPTMAVQTASSSSLAALSMAVLAIRGGQCDQALAGGASLTVPWRAGQVHQEGAVYSRDGSTRPFDAEATGTVFSDGAAMVLLKRLDLARADGDRILGVVRGVGVTNDGGSRASFMAPTVEGQRGCIRRAFQDAGWSPDTVSYVEAHGTATPLGDPVEAEALTRAFREDTDRRGYCALGSLKSNVGHLTAAAGVAGLIKVLLALREERIPASLHFQRANPAIDFDSSPFRVAASPVAWPRGSEPRRAGVSSFGAGGTNVHVLVEDPPEWASPEGASKSVPDPGRSRLLVLSGASPEAVAGNGGALADHLDSHPDLELGAVARTLREGRVHLPFRRAVVARTSAGAAEALRVPASAHRVVERPELVYLLPGQGAQSLAMGRVLYDAFGPVRKVVDRASEILGPVEGAPLRDWLLGEVTDEDAETTLARTSLSQPAIWTLEMAVAEVLREAGLEPRALVGHSLGELTAATLAGVLDFEDGIRAVAERGRLMFAAEPGAMIAARAGVEALEPHLVEGAVLAGINAPQRTVLAGTFQAMDEMERRLDEAGIVARRLRVSHAFHSPSMSGAATAFADFMGSLTLREPSTPFASGVTGGWITDRDATDPEYWGRQILAPVRFLDAVSLPGDDAVFLEVGPRGDLSTLARQTRAPRGPVRATATLDPRRVAASGEEATLLQALGELWSFGLAEAEAPLEALDPLAPGPGARLPSYAFQRRRLWALDDAPDPGAAFDTSVFARVVEAQAEILERQRVLLGARTEG